MTSTADLGTRRLPGVRFDYRTIGAEDVEPRMDIAGFVGFAALGPVDVPVPIDDVARLHEIFGSDTALFVDSATGSVQRAHLVPTVRAFLRNGGLRCWVVRVTGRKPAAPYESLGVRRDVVVPELCTLDAKPLLLRARSVGSWADDLRVSAETTQTPVNLSALALDDDELRFTLAGDTGVGTGDLLRITFAGNEIVYCFVRRIDAEGRLRGGEAGDVRGLLPDGVPTRAAMLRLRLRASRSDGTTWTLDELGLHPSHPRWIGDLPTDEELYRDHDACERPEPPRTPPPLWAIAATPRFPLAGPTDQGPYYPAEPEPLAEPDFAETSLHRDGLAVSHPATVTLDPALCSLGPAALLATADHLRWYAATPRPLLGAHALLGIDEVTLIAAPDLVHRRWLPADSPTDPKPPLYQPMPPPPPPEGPFDDCARPTPLTAPVGLAAEVTGRRITLRWQPVTGAESYVVQESHDPASWVGAADLSIVDKPAQALERGPGARFYRVRAIAGTPRRESDWSVGITAVVAGLPAWRSAEPREAADPALVFAHTGLIRLAAARGDMLALLSLPANTREREVERHAGALRAEVADDRTLSFGALYHPWPVLARSDEVGDVRPLPPDGVVTGIVATRARLRGAWVAPANVGFVDVVALSPGGLAQQPLQDARVNALCHAPQGFCALGADTLSADPDLREIGVRRLLSLLRRIAVRVGAELVFAPDDAAFRRRVRGTFEAVLARMLTRGAFAGVGAADSYRVLTAPAGTVAAEGQVIVDIRVAPSLPLRFLTVRLTRNDGQLAAEELTGGTPR